MHAGVAAADTLQSLLENLAANGRLVELLPSAPMNHQRVVKVQADRSPLEGFTKVLPDHEGETEEENPLVAMFLDVRGSDRYPSPCRR